ncbi:uncharacterized protein A1O9_03676 [Exophiala aquamarina CBS 119918]|uniref:N-acetyltransferase domain-containing protein n=1 Tax=Exophiala aquamarina CBS 119918 TaxID=1182545 RepID=A0A072PHR4_9EURO|nr:uncharacterized protein A1O9_03676 [Exophiala aquamarina CBS 119918]KEF58833.1 hypothetical protein A1O9_03676 [Exophiala aquamarina CBS 119918]
MVWTTSGKVDVDQDATQTWMNRFLPPNDATTFCLSIEELKEPGRVIGSIGCHDSDPVPEVGYMLRTECWGKGYATEAMKYWLQAWWKLPRRAVEVKLDPNDRGSTAVVPEVLKADVVVTNHASKRILERFGFITVHEEMVDDHTVDGEKIKLITLELQRPQ